MDGLSIYRVIGEIISVSIAPGVVHLPDVLRNLAVWCPSQINIPCLNLYYRLLVSRPSELFGGLLLTLDLRREVNLTRSPRIGDYLRPEMGYSKLYSGTSANYSC